MNESEFVFLYSTFPDTATAEGLARELVTSRLAACVNIHAPVTSIYEWEGKIEVVTEVATFIKTRRALVARAIEVAKPLHPYTVPCFLVLPIDGGNEEYLSWARAMTAQDRL